MKLSKNRELYEYLVLLESRSAGALRKEVLAAARAVNTFPAAEFLGESRIALRHVLLAENGTLHETERIDLQDVLTQLNASLDTRQ